MDINSVDAFFGVNPRGNCLVGPYRPFALVRLGPDVAYPYRDRSTDEYSTSGYIRGQPVVRFTHTHVSGTGGVARYGNIAITPFTSKPDNPGDPPTPAFRSFNLPPFWAPDAAQARFEIDKETECAMPGYYSLTYKESGIKVELTTTPRVGLHRYTYPEGKPAWIILDASSVVQPGLVAPGQAYTRTDWDSGPTSVHGRIEVRSKNEIRGYSELRGGWGHDEPYKVFFYLVSDKPFVQIALANATPEEPPRLIAGEVLVQRLSGAEPPEVKGPGCRALINFSAGGQVNLQVGISFKSEEKACEHVKQEVGSKTFDRVRSESVEDWSRILSRFEVQGGKIEDRELFASCLYRLFCMPTYLGTDESTSPESKVPQFTDFYCLWDSVRNANSFFHLFFPALSAQMMNALLDIAENDAKNDAEKGGWLPDAHIAGRFGFMQGGSSADIILAEAVQKGIPGVNAEQALRWTRKNAEGPSPQGSLVKGRLYRDDYEQLGYIPSECYWHPVSRHIEYTYQDWCISRVAGVLAIEARKNGNKNAAGYENDESAFLERARRVWNLWNASAGAFIPRNGKGAWPPDYDPWSKADPDVYEGSVIVWSFNALQDIHGLIKRMGGPERFVERLDELFKTFPKRLERPDGPSDTIFVKRKGRYFEIKETRMHIPHLYTYAGRPDRAAERVRESLKLFRTGEYGLPDNEDMGCQSGYYLWNSMGLYPIYGQTHYMLVPPLFDKVRIKLSPGVQLNDQAKIEDVPPSGDGAELLITADRTRGERYIISATLNDEPLDSAWVDHSQIAGGARIHFVLSDEPGNWSRGYLPPNGM